MADKIRCAWSEADPLLRRYHDTEWGVPLRSDRRLFEFLVLEGMQAGLSWLTVLKKRENFRRAFDGFDPERVARYRPAKVRTLLKDPGIIRNRLKVEAAVSNALAFLEVQRQEGSFDGWIWGLVGGRPLRNRWKTMKQVPCRTYRSDLISNALKTKGFRFVGSTIVYAHMQATGMVNDHLTGCFRHRQIQLNGSG